MSLKTFLTLTCGFLFFVPSIVMADGSSSNSGISAGTFGAGNPQPGLCAQFQHGSTTAATQCSASSPGPFGTYNVQAGATANVATGVLGASADVTVTGLFTGAANSQAGLSYLFDNSNPLGRSLQFAVTVNGSFFGQGVPGDCGSDCEDFELAELQLGGSAVFVPGTPFVFDQNLAFPQGGLQSYLINVPIVNNVAELDMFLSAFAACNSFECTADTDYLDTAQITGAQELDANGKVIQNAVIVSESGFKPNTVPAPEPGTLLLVAMGMAAFAGMNMKRRHV